MAPSAKRPRSKFKVDLSGHGGRYEDVVNDDMTPTLNDEDIESDEEDDDDDNNRNVGQSSESSDSEEEETADNKRLRMAREYLTKLETAPESDEEDESDSDDDDGSSDEEDEAADKVGKRIAKERLRKSGLLQSRIADSVLEGIESMSNKVADDTKDKSAEACAKSWIDAKYVTYLRGHDLTPTCVALSQKGDRAFSGSKDGSVFMWNVEDGKKTTILSPITGRHVANLTDRNEREILAIATSDDDRYLAVGGRDNCVRIFDIRTLGKSSPATPLTTMEGHKKPVNALTFRSRSLDLYSGSEDRCIRRYDLNAMTYVETLYGHQSPIVAIDCANKNRPVSIARDRTVRVWKVEEDSHLVFRGGGDVGSAECISAIQDGWFVTGHDDGRLLLWKEEKKRPVGVITAAHGHQNGVTRSVMCCGALGLSDVLATGSNDGFMRLWKVRQLSRFLLNAIVYFWDLIYRLSLCCLGKHRWQRCRHHTIGLDTCARSHQ